jgi:integrase
MSQIASSGKVALVVESAKTAGALPYWAARWREGDQQPKRRLGSAWLAPTGSSEAKPNGKTYGQRGQWTQHRGRVPEGVLDEGAAMVLAAVGQREWGEKKAFDADERVRATKNFRRLAREWQAHMVKTGAHRASTANDTAYTLAEPGVAYKRRGGESRGTIMRVLGDIPAHRITPADIEKVFEEYEDAGRSNRTINKARELLRAIFNYGCDPRRGWGLTGNPATLTDRRRVHHAQGVRYFEIEQVEAIAHAAASGQWRGEALSTYQRNPLPVEQEREENEQLAELIRFAAYTGLRQGELVVLQWSDINFREHTVTVERAVSGNTIGPPKSGKLRVVPLGAPAFSALKRLRQRPNFTGPEDYVFATLFGSRPDGSALRRRYNRARDAAGAPVLTFHGLRHTAASLFIRKMDAVEVKAIMGHASIKTTERYLHARRASDLVSKVTDALTQESYSDEARLTQEIRHLDPEARARLMELIATN